MLLLSRSSRSLSSSSSLLLSFSMTMWRFLTIASCLLAYLSSSCCVTAQKTIDVADWAVPSGDANSLPPRTAEVGDTAVFTWIFGRIHNVYIHPGKNCDLADRIEVGLETGATYTFTDADAEDGSVFFSCDAFDHCNFGLHVTFTVTQPGTNTGGSSGSGATSSLVMNHHSLLQYLGLLLVTGGGLWLMN